MEEYFTEPVEEERPGGESEILHSPALDVFDGGYVTNKVERIIEKIPDLDSRINEIAKGWTTKRMGKVELTILRLALFEIQYDEDVPEKVAINEAVELAKKFGGDDSPHLSMGFWRSWCRLMARAASVYSVSQVNAYIKNMFAQDFALSRISVKGKCRTASTIHRDIFTSH